VADEVMADDKRRGGFARLAAGDAPVMAIEVIDYMKDIGTVRTGVDGRIVVK
jgi:hypothetical protein